MSKMPTSPAKMREFLWDTFNRFTFPGAIECEYTADALNYCAIVTDHMDTLADDLDYRLKLLRPETRNLND